jgi:hypothetical protein
MNIPKKYLQDRLILLLLSINVFLAALTSVWVLFKLDPGRSASYIVEYRPSLGISKFITGSASDLAAFIGFAVLVLVVHTILSIKVYPIRREVALVILMFGVLLLLMAWIVSNALLGLR